jgi:hypothetical protein
MRFPKTGVADLRPLDQLIIHPPSESVDKSVRQAVELQPARICCASATMALRWASPFKLSA